MSNDSLFSVGDIVTLKSGGPAMTVMEVNTEPNIDIDGDIEIDANGRTVYVPNGNYTCQWFAGKKLESGVFPKESLLAVENNK
ncbi:conserved hypothetical protein [Photobacterium leiognathi lrivu.4.1]|uniref:DUF2158 domain-containing protein n=1 Tax=Photobacterium leiognathi lrivu.4.1 TaxID=1248232 RepID=V5F5X7_PHOLE|nr:DUF2158 domain-containing protein [Photobacterium leiognathi]GAD31318.1 conserved hypothetical protein [Photobacterium leiognathi lrivu.4.1]